MASDPITLWKIEEKKVEAVTGFILWSFNISEYSGLLNIQHQHSFQ